MAIEEHDREDLLRDGRTMPVRGQCTIDGTEVMVGFRALGQASLYCGADPVFQFNAQNQLRRVYFRGEKLAAHGGKLERLTRDRQGGKIRLQALPIDPAQQAEIIAELTAWRQKLTMEVAANWRVIEPAPNEFQQRLQQWLAITSPAGIATSAHA
jgi:hypothetical protein